MKIKLDKIRLNFIQPKKMLKKVSFSGEQKGKTEID